MKARHHITIMEICIAFSLIGVLFVMLFQVLNNWLTVQRMQSKLQSVVLERAFAQQRLDTVFLRLEPGTLYSNGADSLHFYFDNMIDPEIPFSGIVDGELSLSNNALVIRVSPIDGTAHRAETLRGGIHSSAYYFLYFDGIAYKEIDSWDKGQDPSYVRVELCLENGDIENYVILTKHGKEHTL